MIITFESLNESHFPLLLKWLENPHVKKWWDRDVKYTMDSVHDKFGKRTHGIALSKNSNNKIYAYIIYFNKEMIGYIQAYNAHDFVHENGLDLSAISGSIFGVDLFIGDSKFLHKGIGAQILNEFEMQILASHFDWCLIDPAKDNLSAIKAFTKAGFKVFEQFQTKSTTWMIKKLLPVLFTYDLDPGFDKKISCLRRQSEEWTRAFESLVKTGDAKAIETVVTKILGPHGGCFWDGFRFDAPAEWKIFKKVPVKENNTTIIYLTGKPGVGKYTIAKELAAKHGFIVCDNQLINNPIFELLQYDGYAKIPDFAWEAIGNIRRCVLTFLAKEIHNNYVLTKNLYEDSGDKVCYAEVVYIAETRGSFFVPVKLLIDQDEHLRRVTNPSRRDRWKSIDPQDIYDETPLLSISHSNLLELDVTNLSPEDAASAIMNHFKGLTS